MMEPIRMQRAAGEDHAIFAASSNSREFLAKAKDFQN